MKQRKNFQVKADFADIEFYSLEKGSVQIGYNIAFELQEARVAAGISISEFDAMPGIPMWMKPTDSMSKCHLLVWFRKHRLVEAAQNSAQIRESKKGLSKRNFRLGRK